jgi:hypothetical protein
MVARLFMQYCVLFMGLPQTIMSDNDHLITSEWFQTLCKMCGIEQHSSIVYRPQGNGRAERAVQSVVQTLRLVMADTKAKWLTALPWALFVLNNQPGLIQPYSPHKIVFGRDPVGPGMLPFEGVTKISQSCKAWFNELIELRNQVRQSIIKAHKDAARILRRQFKVQTFEPGDKVWVKRRPATGTKLDPLWTGPCEVMEVTGPGRYTINLPEGSEDVHTSSLKPYLLQMSGTAITWKYFQPRKYQEATEGAIVEAILSHRKRKGQLQWKVKWKGSGEITWEPAQSFVGDVQQDWMSYNKSQNLKVELTTLQKGVRMILVSHQ